jgi:tetratricopeptide (TPR) repeat protein
MKMDQKPPKETMDRKSFFQRLRHPEETGELDEFSRKAIEGARQLGDPDRFEAILNRLDEKIERQSGSGRKPGIVRLPYLLGLAASFCLLILVGNWWLKRDERLAYSHFDSLPSALVQSDISRSPLGQIDAVQAALLKYESGEYDEAIPLFEEALESYHKDSSILNLYYGISLLGSGKSAEAIKPLAKAARNREDSVPLQRASNWYLALAHLAEGDKEVCQEVLTELIQEEGDYHDQAVKLRKELDGR